MSSTYCDSYPLHEINVQTMMTTLNCQLPAMYRFVAGFAFTIGIILMVKVLFKLRKAADHRSMMYQPTELIGPMVGLFIAAALIYAPSFMDAATDTLFNTNALQGEEFSVSKTFINTKAQSVALAVFGVLRLIGMIAFVRGWMLLLKSADQGASGQGFLGKGLAHIIAGVLLFHFWWTLKVLGGTFGIPIERMFGQA